MCLSKEMAELKKFQEEALREAASLGDIAAVRNLLSCNVDVNSQNDVNGWTALHWAAHRNFFHVVDLLVKNGANINCLSHKGESPHSLTCSKEIQILLEGVESKTKPPSLPIIPAYLKNQPLCYSVTDNLERNFGLQTHVNNVERKFGRPAHIYNEEELVLKVRLADSDDKDFIEIELPKSEMSFAKLVDLCCKELNISPESVTRIRKLPNTIVRKDKDVQRLTEFQELEIVCSKSLNVSQTNLPTPAVNGNQYESISLKKDQTILY